MKTKFLFLLAFFGGNLSLIAQNYEAYEKTHYYELTAPVVVVSDEDESVELVENGSRFTVIGKKDKDYKIIFWVWGNNQKDSSINTKNERLVYKNSTEKTATTINKGVQNRKIFILNELDFIERAIPYFSKAWDWSAGFVVLPVKIRNTPTVTYSKDLSLGFSGGAKKRISSYNPTYLNFLFNIGISSVSIDSLSTKGRIKQPSDLAALTTALGVVFENHAFQFGLFYGWDRLSANDFTRTNWEYQRKPWISLGIGLQILSKEEKTKSKEEGKNN